MAGRGVGFRHTGKLKGVYRRTTRTVTFSGQFRVASNCRCCCSRTVQACQHFGWLPEALLDMFTKQPCNRSPGLILIYVNQATFAKPEPLATVPGPPLAENRHNISHMHCEAASSPASRSKEHCSRLREGPSRPSTWLGIRPSCLEHTPTTNSLAGPATTGRCLSTESATEPQTLAWGREGRTQTENQRTTTKNPENHRNAGTLPGPKGFLYQRPYRIWTYRAGVLLGSPLGHHKHDFQNESTLCVPGCVHVTSAEVHL